MKKALFATAFLLVFCVVTAFAQADNPEPKRIEIAAGSNSANVKDNLKNGETAEYVFSANAGQFINVNITSSPRGRHFDLRIAGSSFELETDDDDHSAIEFVAPESGNYVIYIVKRNNSRYKNAAFNLTLKIDRPNI